MYLNDIYLGPYFYKHRHSACHVMILLAASSPFFIPDILYVKQLSCIPHWFLSVR